MVVVHRGNQLAKGGTTAVNPPNTVVPSACSDVVAGPWTHQFSITRTAGGAIPGASRKRQVDGGGVY